MVGMIIIFINSGKMFQNRTGSAHLLIDRAKVLKVESDTTILVEILPRIIDGEPRYVTEREDEYSLVTGDKVLAVFSEKNERAKEFMRKLESESIINISRPDNSKIDFGQTPPVVKCTGVDIYDADGLTVVEYF